MKKQHLLGIDIGATNLHVGLVPFPTKGTDLAEYEEPIDVAHGSEGIINQIHRVVERLANRQDIPLESIASIGVGSTGPLDVGTLKHPTNLPFEEVPIVEPLKVRYQVPCEMIGDCHAAVLGEVYFGVGKGQNRDNLNLGFVNIGSGLGVGIYSSGRLLLGKDCNAGEIGHIPLVTNGLMLKCNCGNYGCAEIYCSGLGIAKHGKIQLINENLDSELYTLARAKKARISDSDTWTYQDFEDFIDAELVCQAARQGVPLAERVLKSAIYYGGLVLSIIANTFDPDVITIGGTVAIEAQDLLLDGFRNEMVKHLRVREPNIQVTPLGRLAVLYGAAALAIEQL
ncbi:MAG: ROK family protein [Ignavibacteria bacterium]|nr:ROK family protein [Ignavibacteria bacterium]